MIIRSFIQENEAARVELGEFIARLDERSFNSAVGSGWTISTSLCHLAFWDHRVLFLLRKWESSGQIETSRLSSQSIDSINQAVNAVSQAMPGSAAAKLALDCALAVDSYLTGISDELIGQLVSAGLERYLRRSLHRCEHLQKMREALHEQPARDSLAAHLDGPGLFSRKSKPSCTNLDPAYHSARRDRLGSILVARRAGNSAAAKTPTNTSNPAHANDTGSKVVTP